jgi:hypothetical protein
MFELPVGNELVHEALLFFLGEVSLEILVLFTRELDVDGLDIACGPIFKIKKNASN